MGKQYDLLGQKFGKLIVIGLNPTRAKSGAKIWDCVCDCSNKTSVTSSKLVNGYTKSCGCLQKEVISKANSKRGKYHESDKDGLFKIWEGMIRRTTYLNQDNYKYYGGRGIKVCDEWIEDYFKFKQWSLENGYKIGLSIDRIDVDGNYEPNNCRWIPKESQHYNQRSNVVLTQDGKSQTIAEWSKELNINCSTLYKRHSRGLSVEEILKTK